MAGDIFDIRKYVELRIAQEAHERFFKELENLGVSTYAIIGNHDSTFFRSNEINSIQALYSSGRQTKGMMIVDTEPKEIEIDGTKILLLPWIASSHYADFMKVVDKSRASILVSHLELSGYEMYRGNFMEHGMDEKLFQKFDMVLSGHYHHKSSRDNIHYLGTQYEITWADYGDQKGFHILDTDTRKLEFIHNPFKMFHKVYYDDLKYNTLDDLLNSIDTSSIAGGYVKLVVVNKTKPFWFDRVFDKLEKSDVVNLQIVDESLNLYSEFEETQGTVEDTLTILDKYVDGLDIDIQKEPVVNLMKSLYEEAVRVVEQA
ncbi:recombination endonuclease [Caulobacter phage Cr30]|uniref:recombination endonuclease n=1 Tax=Caulobacter phage Cr30 TaxID=1357714 RepID=UPI0004A9B81E|nr:recombination endonuclease [Caulobacter phage Cr30]AGS81034.1 recombination endonuclease [Caulobacter phage Cr30]